MPTSASDIFPVLNWIETCPFEHSIKTMHGGVITLEVVVPQKLEKQIPLLTEEEEQALRKIGEEE